MENTSVKAEKRFLAEFDDLQMIGCPGSSQSSIAKMKHLLTSKGFELDDPRIKDIIVIIDALEAQGADIDFEMFKDLIRPCYTFFRRILQNQLVINDYDNYYKKTNKLFEKLKKEDCGGFIPNYIPQLAKVNPDGFAVSICTTDGQILNFGDVDNYVCMHHITSVVTYLSALEQHGQDFLNSYIGTEPSGQCFDSLELKDGIPHNPLISSGILTCCSLLFQGKYMV